MPHFYLHLRRGRDLIADFEGTELSHVEAAYLEAFKSAQELWTMLLAKREDPTAYALEVTDERGRLDFVLPLAEVLQTARKSAGLPDREAAARTAKLMARTAALRVSLAGQIDATRQTVVETRALLQRLHQPAERE
jgi:Domain of unknown function (DUF6894)